MPSKKTVKDWGFACLGYECNGDEVKQIWCKLCREYSELATVSHAKKGVAKIASETFVKGTTVIKKNNFAEHFKKSQTHASAIARLSEKRRQSQTTCLLHQRLQLRHHRAHQHLVRQHWHHTFKG